MNEEVIEMVQRFNDEGKPIASICHGPQILISADVIDGKRCTAYPALEDDIINAGGIWADIDLDDAIVDENLVTAQAWTGHPEWLAKFLTLLGTTIEP